MRCDRHKEGPSSTKKKKNLTEDQTQTLPQELSSIINVLLADVLFLYRYNTYYCYSRMFV